MPGDHIIRPFFNFMQSVDTLLPTKLLKEPLKSYTSLTAVLNLIQVHGYTRSLVFNGHVNEIQLNRLAYLLEHVLVRFGESR